MLHCDRQNHRTRKFVVAYFNANSIYINYFILKQKLLINA